MKALVYEGPESLTFQDYQAPNLSRNDVLIQVDSVGICGSDMHAYLGHDDRRPAPLILGHEVAGVIVDAGETDMAVGTRVTVNPLVTCGSCPACTSDRDNICGSREIISMPPREGGFAELLSMPTRNLVIVPDDVPLSKAALVEPIACGWHAVRLSKRHFNPAFAEGCSLVIGGGAIGVGAALSLKAQGMRNVVVVEPNAARRKYLAQHTDLDAISEADLSINQMFDVIIDGVGIEATRALASARARPGGVIAHIGLGSGEGGLDIRRLTLQEISFVGCYTYTIDDFEQTANAMYSGKLGPIGWIDERPLSLGAKAFAELKARKVDAPKIILKP